MVLSNNRSLSAGLNPGVTEPRSAQSYGRVTQDHSGETTSLDPDWATLSSSMKSRRHRARMGAVYAKTRLPQYGLR